MEAIVFIILQIFFAMSAVLKIGEYPRIFPNFSWGIFAHGTRLDQSRASENIWWIITIIIAMTKNIHNHHYLYNKLLLHESALLKSMEAVIKFLEKKNQG